MDEPTIQRWPASMRVHTVYLGGSFTIIWLPTDPQTSSYFSSYICRELAPSKTHSWCVCPTTKLPSDIIGSSDIIFSRVFQPDFCARIYRIKCCTQQQKGFANINLLNPMSQKKAVEAISPSRLHVRSTARNFISQIEWKETL